MSSVWASAEKYVEMVYEMVSKSKIERENVMKKELYGITKKLVDLEAQIHCGAVYEHHFTLVRFDGYGYSFQCTNCTLRYYKAKENLNQTEKKLVAAVFPKQE